MERYNGESLDNVFYDYRCKHTDNIIPTLPNLYTKVYIITIALNKFFRMGGKERNFEDKESKNFFQKKFFRKNILK